MASGTSCVEILHENIHGLHVSQDKLKQNVEEVKNQIDKTFEDLLCSLHARRTQLQRQVDVFVTQHLSALVHEQSWLQYMHRSFQEMQNMVETGMGDTKLLMELMQKNAKGIKKREKWNSEIHFSSNERVLKAAIHSWGKVEMSRIWMTSGNQTVTYLPENPEEYDDVDQLSYKSVLGATDEIRVRFSKVLNQNMNDWLLPRTTTKKDSDSNVSSSCDTSSSEDCSPSTLHSKYLDSFSILKDPSAQPLDKNKQMVDTSSSSSSDFSLFGIEDISEAIKAASKIPYQVTNANLMSAYCHPSETTQNHLPANKENVSQIWSALFHHRHSDKWLLMDNQKKNRGFANNSCNSKSISEAFAWYFNPDNTQCWLHQ